MAIEVNATNIGDLNPAYPQDRDYLAEGAAHLRLIKNTLKTTFPNVNGPVNVSSDQFDLFANKITLAGDYMDVGGLMVKNATAGTGPADLVTKSQMESYLTSFMQNHVYRVNSYYTSEDPTNPGDSTVLGFGVWVPVTGMLMGSGTINPDGSVPNAQARQFTAGQSGGRVYNDVKPENLPLTSIDLSGVTTANDGAHTHTIELSSSASGTGHPDSGNNTNDGVASTQVGGAHTHRLQGSATFGRDSVSKQPIETLPPYRVVNIWRRTQ